MYEYDLKEMYNLSNLQDKVNKQQKEIDALRSTVQLKDRYITQLTDKIRLLVRDQTIYGITQKIIL